MKKIVRFLLMGFILCVVTGCVIDDATNPNEKNNTTKPDNPKVEWPDFLFPEEQDPFQLWIDIKPPVDPDIDYTLPDVVKPGDDIKQEYLAFYNAYCKEASSFTNYTLSNNQDITIYAFNEAMKIHSEEVYFVDWNTSIAKIRSNMDGSRSEMIIRQLQDNYVSEQVYEKKMYRDFLSKANETDFATLLMEYGVLSLAELLANDGSFEGVITKVHETKYNIVLDFGLYRHPEFEEFFASLGLTEDVLAQMKLHTTVEVNPQTKAFTQKVQLNKILIDREMNVSMDMKVELLIKDVETTLVAPYDENAYPAPKLDTNIELIQDAYRIVDGYVFTDQDVSGVFDYYASIQLDAGTYGIASDFQGMDVELLDQFQTLVTPKQTRGYMRLYDLSAGAYFLKIFDESTSLLKYNVEVRKITESNPSTSSNPLPIDNKLVLYHALDRVFVSKTCDQEGFLKVTSIFDNPAHGAVVVSPTLTNPSLYHKLGAKYKYVKAGETVVFEIQASPNNGYFTETALYLETELLPVTAEEKEVGDEFSGAWTLTGKGKEPSSFKLTISQAGTYDIKVQTLVVQYTPQPSVSVYKLDGTKLTSIGRDRWKLEAGDYKVVVNALSTEDGIRLKKTWVAVPEHKSYGIFVDDNPRQIILEPMVTSSTLTLYFTLEADSVLVIEAASELVKFLDVYEADGYLVKKVHDQINNTITYNLPAQRYFVRISYDSNFPSNSEFKIYLTN